MLQALVHHGVVRTVVPKLRLVRIFHAGTSMVDHLPPVPGRLHNSVNKDTALGNELYIAITSVDEHGQVRVVAQNIESGTGTSMPFVSECILCDP